MFKRLSLVLAISLHMLTWGVASESALSNTPRAHFSLAELFTPSTCKMFAPSLLKAPGRFLPVDYQKGAVTSQSANCPPCPPVPRYKIGDFAEGGVVIWLTEDGQHGLVAAITDAGGPLATYNWGPTTALGSTVRNNQSLPFSTPVASYGQYYGGYQNQMAEFIQQNLSLFPAFQAAAQYEAGDYTDWWLPSSRELSLMYSIEEKINQVSTANNGTSLRKFAYWSSRENLSNSTLAWFLNFFNGCQGFNNKGNSYAVRCVRAF